MLHNSQHSQDNINEQKSEITRSASSIRLGNISKNLPLYPLPNNTGYFHYFKLNDHADLVTEGARLIAERIKSLTVNQPFFVTAEASTLALAHELRSRHAIEGVTLYKTIQINDVDPLSVEYDAITSLTPKKLFLGKEKLAQLQNKNLFILDSVCTSGGTLSAMGNLLLKAGIPTKNIIEATVLFTEGDAKSHVPLNDGSQVKVHHFSHLPIVSSLLTKNSLFKSPPKQKFKIVLASESACKANAVIAAAKKYYTHYDLDIVCVNTKSGVPEQPFEEETELGASNRLAHAEKIYPAADLYIAIENGLYEEGQRFFDKALIKLKKPKEGFERITTSAKVEFPREYVEKARAIGFDKITVGECMYQAGLVKDAKDPHASLAEKISRQTLLEDALACALPAIEAHDKQLSNRPRSFTLA